MAFQFNAASISVIKGDDFYRIKARSIDQASAGLETELGPGDLIPIDTGFSAIAVGPESDYDKYELVYFNDLGGVQVIPFSTDRPFVGNIPVDNTTEYPDSGGELKKAYIRIADPSTADGRLANAAAAGRVAVTIADIIVYTKAPPTVLPTKRYPNRRSSNIAVLPIVEEYFYIPGYGRRELLVEASKVLVPDVTTVSLRVDGSRLYQPFASNPLDTVTGTLLGKVLVQSLVTNLLVLTALPNTAPLVAPLTNDFASLSFGYNAEIDGLGRFDFYRATITSSATRRPEDFYAGMGVHLNMEVRD